MLAFDVTLAYSWRRTVRKWVERKLVTQQKIVAGWVKPQLVRLGQLKDVAPRGPGVGEGNSGKS
jgi:hypothetical protein